MVVLLSVSAPALARPGDMDPAFSQDGFAQVDLTSKAGPGAYSEAGAAVPIGFGTNGEVILGANTLYSYDCAHTIGCAHTESYVALARFLSNGTLDSSFAGDGTFEDDLESQGRVQAAAYAVQPDGRILIAGTARGQDAVIARVTTDGALDASFAGDGVMTLEMPDIQKANDLALAPDGRIVVGGTAAGGQAPNQDLGRDHLVFRVLGDGTLDPSFGGGDGIATTDLSPYDEITNIALDDSGRGVAAGVYEASVPFGQITAVLRFSTDGSLDPSFAEDGSVLSDLAPERPSLETVSELVIDSSDRPLLSISAFRQPLDSPEGEKQLRALVRFEADGRPDSAFGPNGKHFLDDVPGDTPQTWAAAAVGALALDSNGRILVAGGYPLMVSRRLNNGNPDPDFGRAGWVQVRPPQGAGTNGLFVGSDGKIVVGGSTLERPGRAQIARLRADSNGLDDLDADLRPDRDDPCPSVFAPAVGCPTYPRALTIRRVKSGSTGLLESVSPGCLRGARILLFRKRNGADRRVMKSAYPTEADAAPNEYGSPVSTYWGLGRPQRPGRYYAVVRPSFDPMVGTCGRAQSRVIRLRPQRDK